MSLEYEIRIAEGVIKQGEKKGRDMSYDKMLVKNWRQYLPGGKYHHLWKKHSAQAMRNGRH